MSESRERIRVLRQVEHGVLSEVEKANGIVTLLGELARSNESSVAVAAVHCLRRIFTQLLDPSKNPQLPRKRPNPSAGERRSSGGRSEVSKNKKEKKKRPRADDAEEGVRGDGVLAPGAAVLDGRGGLLTEDKAAKTYQEWLEARYVDYLRALLGWVSEVDDFQRQRHRALRTELLCARQRYSLSAKGPALRTLMHFVEMEPSLCFSVAQISASSAASSEARGGARREARMAGEGTIWGGLCAEIMRAVVLGPCSMQPKLLKSLGEDYANVHDDIRYYLLGNVTAIAKRALSDHKSSSNSLEQGGGKRSQLPADSPLRGYLGASKAFTRSDGIVVAGSSTAVAVTGSKAEDVGARFPADGSERRSKKKRRTRKGKAGDGRDDVNDEAAMVSGENSRKRSSNEGDGVGAGRMELAEVSGRLAQVLMVVRMVEEQSNLTAFLLPVGLSLPSSASRGFQIAGGDTVARGDSADGRRAADADAQCDASSSGSDSSGSDSSDGEQEGGEGVVERDAGKRGIFVAGSTGGKQKDSRSNVSRRQSDQKEREGRKTTRNKLAIERLRYHKKAFGDAWFACLRLPLQPAVYRRVLLFLPGNVIPYIPSPVRLADFLTESYAIGGVQAVLALDALFLLMQFHDLEYPNFYDSLYRMVTPTIMYAKYRARFFRMVDLCLSSSHVPAYVVAAFLKRFARASLQAPPSGALFALALARKMIGRHPECAPLIRSSNAKARGAKTPSVSGAYPNGVAEADKPGAFVDEYDPASETSKGANALRTSLWELAALQKHYHPSVATLARGFLQEAGTKRDGVEVFAAPSKLAGETYQTLFDQEMRRKPGKVALAFRRPKGIFDDVPEEGGGVFASLKFTL